MGGPGPRRRTGVITVKVLVTGATSMIGQHVVARLLDRGDAVTVVQRRASQLKGVTEIRCDLADRNGLDHDHSDRHPLDIALEHVDAVVHLAARVGVTGRWEAFEAVNIGATQRLLGGAKKHGVDRFIHVSTPSVAHAGNSLVGAPAGPADPEHVRGHYARSKARGEQIALATNGAEMKVVALRPHLVWGPGDTQLIQRIVDRARAGRLALVGSGLALIDTTYVDNAASAIVAGIDAADRVAGRALVISNGQPRAVSEIIQRILLAAGLPTGVRHVPSSIAIGAGAVVERAWDRLDKTEDPPMTRFLAEQLATAHWFDQRSTRELLDWQPTVGLDDGFARLATSFQQ